MQKAVVVAPQNMTLRKNARSSGFDILTAYGKAIRRTFRGIVQLHEKERKNVMTP
jgi:hypothetical protein